MYLVPQAQFLVLMWFETTCCKFYQNAQTSFFYPRLVQTFVNVTYLLNVSHWILFNKTVRTQHLGYLNWANNIDSQTWNCNIDTTSMCQKHWGTFYIYSIEDTLLDVSHQVYLKEFERLKLFHWHYNINMVATRGDDKIKILEMDFLHLHEG